MFPCPTSDCSYSVENKTEIRQVKISHIFISLLYTLNGIEKNVHIDFSFLWGLNFTKNHVCKNLYEKPTE